MRHVLNTFAVLILSTAIPSLAQQTDNWIWTNPQPHGNNQHALDFVDDHIGYAVGAFGTVMKTTDGGVQWSKVDAGETAGLHSVHFLDASSGYIGGPRQRLRRTTDGSETWTTIQLPREGQFDSLHYAIRWSAASAASGVYLARLESAGSVQVRRMLLPEVMRA